MIRLTILFVSVFVVDAQADYSWVKSAKWSSVLGYTKCGFFGECTIYENAKVDARNAAVGDVIRITDSGKEVDKFKIKGIAYEAYAKKCWLTKKSGKSDTYLAVPGCRPQ